jgi:hypothetical protein
MSKHRPGVWVSWRDASGVYHRVYADTAQIAKRWRRELTAEGATQIKIERS